MKAIRGVHRDGVNVIGRARDDSRILKKTNMPRTACRVLISRFQANVYDLTRQMAQRHRYGAHIESTQQIHGPP